MATGMLKSDEVQMKKGIIAQKLDETMEAAQCCGNILMSKSKNSTDIQGIMIKQDGQEEEEQKNKRNGLDTYPLAKMEVMLERPNSKKQQPLTKHDFTKIGVLGKGSFGKVNLVERKGKYYALKELFKDVILKTDKIDHIFRERDILNSFNHQAFPKLYSTFQDESKLYFVLEYIPNGSFDMLLNSFQTLPQDLVRYYSAQLVNAIAYMQQQNVIHRDLKPQNILLDSDFNLKIIDFGDAKMLNSVNDDFNNDDTYKHKGYSPDTYREHYNDSGNYNRKNSGTGQEVSDRFFNSRFENNEEEDNDDDEDQRGQLRKGTFVGTPLYVSPEMLESSQSGVFTDLWALGCIIYEMMVGKSPFHADSDHQVFKNILELNLEFPPNFDPITLDLIRSLLQINPQQRLGYSSKKEGIETIKKHPFFVGIDFQKIEDRKVQIPRKEMLDQYYEVNLKAFHELCKEKQSLKQLANHQKKKMDEIRRNSSIVKEELKLKRQETFDKLISEFNIVEKYDMFDASVLFSSEVKKRQKYLPIFEKRKLLLLENKSIIFQRLDGQIDEEIKLNKEFQIHEVQNNDLRFQIINTKENIYRVMECDERESWVTVLNFVKDDQYEQYTKEQEQKLQQKLQ